jgi:ribonuclease P protein component
MDASDIGRPDASLPRGRILRGRSEFTRLFTRGEGVRTGKLLVKFLRTGAEPGSLKAGFIVRRSAGGAVRRNRVRRAIREAYRLERSEFESSLGDSLGEGMELHLAFLWLGNREASGRVRYQEIENEVRTALRKLSRRLRSDSDADTERK